MKPEQVLACKYILVQFERSAGPGPARVLMTSLTEGTVPFRSQTNIMYLIFLLQKKNELHPLPSHYKF